MKATSVELKDAYAELGNVWKVADRFGMCGQSVYERLVKLKLINSMNVFTAADQAFLMAEYPTAISVRGGLSDLANRMNRTKQFICRQARKLGLTDIARAKHPDVVAVTAAGVKAHIKANGHPRGMLGKTHTAEVGKLVGERAKIWFATATPEQIRERTLKQLRTGAANGTLYRNRKASWKAGWREFGERRGFYRSKWEANYGRYLQWMKEQGQIQEWDHEPETFWFNSSTAGRAICYLPDFKITGLDNLIEYHEVKGWMDERSQAKLDAMQKWYPDVLLLIIQKNAYMSIVQQFSKNIDGWET